MAKRGTSAITPTAKQRKDVMLYVAGSIAESAIADVLGICQNTLRAHFAVELECGCGIKRAENLKRLESAAKAGNVAAMKALHVIFEKNKTEDGMAAAQNVEQKVRGRLTKKQLLKEDAITAGVGTAWGDDLKPPADTLPN